MNWFLSLLCFGFSAQAQSPFLQLEEVAIADGLAATADIRALLQDRFGFIWIGTTDGLDMYDGYNFTHYQHKPFDGASLSANAITALFEDRAGTLWVGTVSGLCRMNAKERATGRFFQYHHNVADSTSLSSDVITAIAQDSVGTIYVGTTRGLNQLGPSTNKFKRYLPQRGNAFGLNDPNITALVVDGKGTLWVGTRTAGLKKFEAATERFLTYNWQPPERKHQFAQYHSSIYFLFDSLQKTQTPLAALLRIGDSEHRKAVFTLEAPANVLIVAMGEGVEEPLADRGWLTRNGVEKPVWQMHVVKTRHAGGALKNRVCIEFINLPAGSYELNFLTDDSHSFARWNARPPARPQDWGIQVFRIDAMSARRWQAQLQKTFVPTALSNPSVTSILPDPQQPNDVLWVGTLNGLNCFDTTLETFSSYFHDPADSNSISANVITALCADDSNRILIGTAVGRIDQFDRKRRRFTPLQSKRYNGINTLLQDRASTLWIGSENAGLLKSVKKKFRHHLLAEPGSAANNILAFHEDSSGLLWLGTADGLWAYDRTQSRYAHFKYDLNNFKDARPLIVTSIYEDEAGVLWLATWGAGLKRFDRTTKTFRPAQDKSKGLRSFDGAVLRVVTGDRRGGLWIATHGEGLNHFNPTTGDIKRYMNDPNDPHSLPANEVNHLYVDRTGTLWVATVLGGLAQFDEAAQRFNNFTYEPDDTAGFPNKTVMHIFEDREGRLWFGTYSGGLCQLQKRTDGRITFLRYTVDDGLPGNMIQGLVQDDDGIFWISTNHGLTRFDPAQPRGQQFRNYSVADGLQSRLFNQNALCMSRTGELFVGGNNGFNSFIPRVIKDRVYSPPVLLTQFKTFDQTMQFNQPLASLKDVGLKYSQNFFSFEFVALDYANAAGIQYAFKLEGLNDNWMTCGTRRYANFTNVDPGEYRFRVKATNSDGVWGENEAMIHISIAPPFWRTTWFYLMSLGVALFVAYAFFQYRVRAQVKKSLELERIRLFEREKVREQIARDYHDEMGHKITKVALFTELITRNVNGIATELKEHLTKVVEASQSLSLDARNFIWTLNPEKDSLYELCLHLQEFGIALFEEAEINFHLHGLSEEMLQFKLNMEWKRHLTLLFKEGMHNALKHARCKNVALELNVQNGFLRMTLRDDGVGLTAVNGHYRNGNGAGLENMRRRAQSLRGHLEISSPEGRGTMIQFSSELPRNGY